MQYLLLFALIIGTTPQQLALYENKYLENPVYTEQAMHPMYGEVTVYFIYRKEDTGKNPQDCEILAMDISQNGQTIEFYERIDGKLKVVWVKGAI